ncbi:MAG: hypothetical protein ACLPHP_03770 [Candidatus Sulfotelmatobacter sp.]
MRPACLLCLLIALTGISAAQDTNQATSQDTSFSAGPQYLITSSFSPLFARPIATPSISLAAPLPEIQSPPAIGPVVENQPFVANSDLSRQPDLFPIYYGTPMTSVVEITSAEPPRSLPASIVDSGVTGITDAQSLRERGYGAPLGDTAAFWKAHKARAPRVYTNADVQRLRPS